MAEIVRITDVSPRDGLQNEPRPIPTIEKVRLVELLTRTGVEEIEVTSFVSPKWVPQLGDAAEVLAEAAKFKKASLVYSVLVPNEKGLEAALAVNQAAGSKVIDKVSVFTAASETFSKKNTNATIAETVERFKPVVERAAREQLLVRVYVSCAFACPFEGPTPIAQLQRVLRLLSSNIPFDELDLGDTIGAATPESTRDVIAGAKSADTHYEKLAPTAWVLHFHDTFGRAAECVKVALDMGIRSFDGAAGGLGGCPYASTPGKRAPGNIATETLIAAVEAAGFTTGVNRQALAAAGQFAQSLRTETNSGISP